MSAVLSDLPAVLGPLPMAATLSFVSVHDPPPTLVKSRKRPQSGRLIGIQPLVVSSCRRFLAVAAPSSSVGRVSSSWKPVEAHGGDVVESPELSFVTEDIESLNSSSGEDVVESTVLESVSGSHDTSPTSSKLVLVVGGSGGVGQLVVASLLDRNIKSRLLLRDPEKAATLFGKQDEKTLQVYKGDTRDSKDLNAAIFEGVTHVICCTGTTAFPSRRWTGDNTPERVDWEGVRNLVSALPSSVKRVVLVSSVGVTKFDELPWSIMNLFGVLKYKKKGEDFLRNSGHVFTIIRAGRLTDGPYTSYDLNTLLKATAGERRAVVIGQGDKLVGEVSRLVVAEACIQVLDIEFTEGKVYEINSVEGDGPGKDPQKWQELFRNAESR